MGISAQPTPLGSAHGQQDVEEASGREPHPATVVLTPESHHNHPGVLDTQPGPPQTSPLRLSGGGDGSRVHPGDQGRVLRRQEYELAPRPPWICLFWTFPRNHMLCGILCLLLSLHSRCTGWPVPGRWERGP